MTKRSNSSDQSASKTHAMMGYASFVPVKTTVNFKGGGGAEGSYESKSRISYGDKQSGSYGRETVTKKASEREFEWKNGTTGTRSEYTQSSKVRFGDRKGYTEVYREEKIRDVTYDRSGCSSKNYITYGNEAGGSYGGYGNKNDNGDGPYGGYGNKNDNGDGPYGGYGKDSDDVSPYGGHVNDSDEDGGPYGGHGNDSEDGGGPGNDSEDGGGHGNDSEDGGGPGNDSEDGGGHGNDSEDGGSYGDYGYNSDDGGSYGGNGYDSDY